MCMLDILTSEVSVNLRTGWSFHAFPVLTLVLSLDSPLSLLASSRSEEHVGQLAVAISETPVVVLHPGDRGANLASMQGH